MQNSNTFGAHVAAEVHCRGLALANRRACVCDGQTHNGSILEMHLLPSGFVPIKAMHASDDGKRGKDDKRGKGDRHQA